MRKNTKYSPNINKFVISVAVASIPGVGMTAGINGCVIFHDRYDVALDYYNSSADITVEGAWRDACSEYDIDAYEVCNEMIDGYMNFTDDLNNCWNERVNSNACSYDYATGDISALCNETLCPSGEYVGGVDNAECVTCPSYNFDGIYINAESDTHPEYGSNGISRCYIPSGKTFTGVKGKFKLSTQCRYPGS